MINIRNVSKIFQGKSVAVDDVSLAVEKGEIFGIIGYSGAGKSTLVRMLNGLEHPTSGDVEVAGHKLSSMKASALRKVRQDIGMIFQHFNLLWSRTVRENIAFPLEIAGVSASERRERVEELIKLVGLEAHADHYPAQLSGGQKQRVGIARALANQPKVLLCDEATSALDPETTDSILNLLMDINKRFGLTIVLITHEMHVIQKICHRVAVMENGKVVEVNKVLNIFKNPEHEVTRRFVKQLSDGDDAKATTKHLLSLYPSGKVARLTFIGESAEQPILAEVIRNFEVQVNIIQGKISPTTEGPVGTLYIHLNGEEEVVQQVIQFLNEQEIGVEVVNYE